MRYTVHCYDVVRVAIPDDEADNPAGAVLKATAAYDPSATHHPEGTASAAVANRAYADDCLGYLVDEAANPATGQTRAVCLGPDGATPLCLTGMAALNLLEVAHETLRRLGPTLPKAGHTLQVDHRLADTLEQLDRAVNRLVQDARPAEAP